MAEGGLESFMQGLLVSGQRSRAAFDDIIRKYEKKEESDIICFDRKSMRVVVNRGTLRKIEPRYFGKYDRPSRHTNETFHVGMLDSVVSPNGQVTGLEAYNKSRMGSLESLVTTAHSNVDASQLEDIRECMLTEAWLDNDEDPSDAETISSQDEEEGSEELFTLDSRSDVDISSSLLSQGHGNGSRSSATGTPQRYPSFTWDDEDGTDFKDSKDELSDSITEMSGHFMRQEKKQAFPASGEADDSESDSVVSLEDGDEDKAPDSHLEFSNKVRKRHKTLPTSDGASGYSGSTIIHDDYECIELLEGSDNESSFSNSNSRLSVRDLVGSSHSVSSEISPSCNNSSTDGPARHNFINETFSIDLPTAVQITIEKYQHRQKCGLSNRRRIIPVPVSESDVAYNKSFMDPPSKQNDYRHVSENPFTPPMIRPSSDNKHLSGVGASVPALLKSSHTWSGKSHQAAQMSPRQNYVSPFAGMSSKQLKEYLTSPYTNLSDFSNKQRTTPQRRKPVTDDRSPSGKEMLLKKCGRSPVTTACDKTFKRNNIISPIHGKSPLSQKPTLVHATETKATNPRYIIALPEHGYIDSKLTKTPSSRTGRDLTPAKVTPRTTPLRDMLFTPCTSGSPRSGNSVTKPCIQSHIDRILARLQYSAEVREKFNHLSEGRKNRNVGVDHCPESISKASPVYPKSRKKLVLTHSPVKSDVQDSGDDDDDDDEEEESLSVHHQDRQLDGNKLSPLRSYAAPDLESVDRVCVVAQRKYIDRTLSDSPPTSSSLHSASSLSDDTEDYELPDMDRRGETNSPKRLPVRHVSRGAVPTQPCETKALYKGKPLGCVRNLPCKKNEPNPHSESLAVPLIGKNVDSGRVLQKQMSHSPKTPTKVNGRNNKQSFLMLKEMAMEKEHRNHRLASATHGIQTTNRGSSERRKVAPSDRSAIVAEHSRRSDWNNNQSPQSCRGYITPKRVTDISNSVKLSSGSYRKRKRDVSPQKEKHQRSEARSERIAPAPRKAVTPVTCNAPARNSREPETCATGCSTPRKGLNRMMAVDISCIPLYDMPGDEPDKSPIRAPSVFSGFSSDSFEMEMNCTLRTIGSSRRRNASKSVKIEKQSTLTPKLKSLSMANIESVSIKDKMERVTEWLKSHVNSFAHSNTDPKSGTSSFQSQQKQKVTEVYALDSSSCSELAASISSWGSVSDDNNENYGVGCGATHHIMPGSRNKIRGTKYTPRDYQERPVKRRKCSPSAGSRDIEPVIFKPLAGLTMKKLSLLGQVQTKKLKEKSASSHPASSLSDHQDPPSVCTVSLSFNSTMSVCLGEGICKKPVCFECATRS